MKIFRTFDELNISEPVSMTLGKFDGVHKGHIDLLERLEGKKFVFTFDISGSEGLITTAFERRERFKELGVDYLFECPFDKEVMDMAPETFLRKLTEHTNVRKIVAGTDFRFGKDRSGDCGVLSAMSKKYGYELEVVAKLVYGKTEISSSGIRDEIAAGHMEKVRELLGLPYFCDGCVVTGNRIGRTIGFPTANVPVDHAKLMPPFGVYKASLVTKEGDISAVGIADLGRKPTVESEGKQNPVCIEINLFDFSEDIYGRDVRVFLHRFIRAERKFDNIDELKKQITKDILQCKE